MKRGMAWPIGIVATLLLSAGGQVWFALVARGDKAFAVEGNYYDKAIHWDAELAQRQASARLGWHVSPTLRLGAGNGEGSLVVELRDSSGTLITGATVQVLAMHNARANRQLAATLVEQGAGRYAAPLPAQRPGEWELRFIVQRGRERFTVSERVDAAKS